MSKQNEGWPARLPLGLSIVIKQPLMVRINRAMRTRCCIECFEPIKPTWPGVTCGSKKCMAAWLPGKGEAVEEIQVVEE